MWIYYICSDHQHNYFLEPGQAVRPLLPIFLGVYKLRKQSALLDVYEHRDIHCSTCNCKSQRRFLRKCQDGKRFPAFNIRQLEVVLLQVLLQAVIFFRILGKVASLNPEKKLGM
jgi:hypothetical protein